MTVNVPKSELYGKDNLDLPTDEVLYGWNVKALSVTDRYILVSVPMYYEGYADLRNFSAKKYDSDMILTRTCAGAYEQPSFRSKELMCLYMGSFLKSTGKETDGFTEIIGVDGEKFYVHSSSVAKKSEKFDADRLVTVAKIFLGSPYKWGGKTAAGIDCSGFVAMCYYMCGVEIFRDSNPDKTPCFSKVPQASEKGDVVYLRGHVGLYVGNGTVVHSSWSCGKVTYCKLSEFLELGEYVCTCRLTL